MLKELEIVNIRLIEHVQLTLPSMWIVLTGESGSGKSSVVEALRLLLGGRIHSEVIRREQDQGWVEATFGLENLPQATLNKLLLLLSQEAIALHPGGILRLRRQLQREGKGSITANNKKISLNLLSLITPHLLEIVDGRANHGLEEITAHRDALDRFAALSAPLERCASLYHELKGLERERDQCLQQLPIRNRKRQELIMEREELLGLKMVEGEPTQLQEQLSRIGMVRAVLEALQVVHQASHHPIFHQLHKAKLMIQRYHEEGGSQRCEELCQVLDGGLIQFDEAAQQAADLCDEVAQEEQDPQVLRRRLHHLQTAILKYGATPQEHQLRLQLLDEELERLDLLEAKLKEIEGSLPRIQEEYYGLIRHVSETRAHHAPILQEALTSVLRELNMPHVYLKVELRPIVAGPSGQEEVEIWLAPNVGERALSLRGYASGGELARVFLALKMLQADQHSGSTLIFDEVDANMGGHSAAKMAQCLRELSQQRQVICVSHFSQVAREAASHWVVEKKVVSGRSQSCVRELVGEVEKEMEIKRMLGELETALILQQDHSDQ